MKRKTGNIVSNNRRFIPLLVTITLFFVVYALGMLFYPAMRDPQVFFNLFRTSPFLLISAIGMTFVIISGGIDLSVSGVVALTTVASAALLRDAGWNPWAVIVAMLAMGMAIGAIMGAFITYMKVQPFIATLAGMWIARGLCFFISDDAIAINSRVYRVLGQTKILIPGLADPVTKKGDYISILVVVSLLVLAVAMYIAHLTRFGRTVYAMGGSEQSARLMGLPVDRTKVLVYTLNGFCSALAGITLSIYVLSGHGLYAQGFELTVIAAVVIGGTMLTGGAGYVFGTLFGVLITGLIQTLILFNGKLELLVDEHCDRCADARLHRHSEPFGRPEEPPDGHHEKDDPGEGGRRTGAQPAMAVVVRGRSRHHRDCPGRACDQPVPQRGARNRRRRFHAGRCGLPVSALSTG